jgi:hypothetical protein
MRRGQLPGGVSLLVALAGTALATAAAPARAADRVRTGAACASVAHQAHALLQQAKLREAEGWLQKCAQPRCAAAVRRDCTARLSQLASDIPTVIPVVTDEAGQSMTEVEVMMDGQLLTGKADGRALPIDPGEHEFSFKSASGKELKHKKVILQGQRNQVLPLSLAPPTAERPAAAARPTAEVDSPSEEPQAPTRAARSSEDPPDRKSVGHPVAPWVMTAIGVAGLTSFGVLASWGRRDDQILVKNCSPDCNPRSIDHVRDLYLGAKISLGVGLAALGTATILFISNGSSDTREAAARSPRYVLDVRPTSGGTLAAVSGRF